MTDNLRLPPSTTKQEQNAFRFSLAMTIVMGIMSALLLIFYGLPKGLLDLTTLVIMVAIASTISTVLTRMGKHIIGILLLIGSLLLACIITAILFSGFGAVLALVALIISFGTGSVALPTKYAYFVNTISVMLGLGFILLDIIEPFERQPNNDPTMTWIIAGVLALIFGIGIFRNFGTYNFRTKLIISFVFTSVVTLGILAVFNQSTTTNILRTNLGGQLKNQTEIRATQIGDLLNEQVTNLTILMLNEQIEASAIASNEAYSGDDQSILAEIEQLDQQWRTADAADNNNDPLVQKILSHESVQELKEFQEVVPGNIEVFFTDRYGALIGTTNRTSDYYQADEDWWQAAYNAGAGGIYISDPEFDQSAGEFSVLIAIPILNEENGEITGILRTTYQMSTLTAILGKPIGETGKADLYIPGDFPLTPPQYIHEGKLETVVTNTYNQIIELSDQPYAEMYYEGIDSIISNAPVTDQEGNPTISELGWFVTVHQSVEEIFAPIQDLTQIALGLVIVIVGVATAIAVGLAQLLVAPIGRLTSTAQEIAAGDLSIQAEVTTQDEVGILANAFNDMTTRLRDTLAGLEERIAARTRDLELAAEVGRRLSLVRETGIMLNDAVNIIQERFDLYYTQVYLTDPTGRSLVLRAGTGEVGQTLLGRSHRLPLDMGSLNGIAATERRTIVVEDTTASTIFRPNPLLADTRSEMSVPLIVGERVVGVLNMQSAQPGTLNNENQTAFEAMAGSLAIAISNAGLFEQAEAARTTVEEQARRLTSTGWQDFLDAIERSERLAFTYNNQTISALPEAIPGSSDTDLVTPIQISGATVGQIHFERDRAWTENDQSLVQSVSRQVAQQIDNLRLLAQAQQYQAASQEALRQLTQEGWELYQTTRKDRQVGFIYSDHEVKPLGEEATTEPEKALSYPISVRNETIGHLDILGPEALSDSDTELVAYLTEQLSKHLENLRLSQQTQVALAETEDQSKRLAALNELSERLNFAENLDDIRNTSALYLDRIIPASYIGTTWLTGDGSALEVYEFQGEAGAKLTGTKLPLEDTAAGAAFKERRVVRIPDLSQSNYLENTQLGERGLRSTMVVPLLTTDRVLGTLNFSSQNLDAFDNRQRDLAIQAASLISSIIENQELFAQTQSALAQTEILYEIGRKLNIANNAEEILASINDTAVKANCKQTILMYIDQDRKGKPEWLNIVAAWSQESTGGSPIGTRMSAAQYPLMAAIIDSPDKPIMVPDISTAEQIDDNLKGMWLSRGFQAICIVPLGQAGQWQGLLILSWNEPHEFSDQEKTIFGALVSLVTPAVQSRRLYKQAQSRAQREQALSQITAAVRGTTDPATILQTAVREIGTTLGRKAVIRFGKQDQAVDIQSNNGNDDTQPA